MCLATFPAFQTGFLYWWKNRELGNWKLAHLFVWLSWIVTCEANPHPCFPLFFFIYVTMCIVLLKFSWRTKMCEPFYSLKFLWKWYKDGSITLTFCYTCNWLVTFVPNSTGLKFCGSNVHLKIKINVGAIPELFHFFVMKLPSFLILFEYHIKIG